MWCPCAPLSRRVPDDCGSELCCCPAADSLENDPFFAGARDDDAGNNGADSGAARRRPRLTSAERAEKRAKRAADREAKEREAAELELLMLNEVRCPLPIMLVLGPWWLPTLELAANAVRCVLAPLARTARGEGARGL